METRLFEESQIPEIVKLLENGEVVGIPTDTVYGIACVYHLLDAIQKMKVAKGRPETKPFPMMVANKEQIMKVAYVDERTSKIIDCFMPGALTIIVPKKECIDDSVTNGAKTIAIRMADDPLMMEIIHMVNEPLLVTSANLSGEPSMCSYEDVYDKLNGRIAGLIKRDATGTNASTIIDLTGEEIKVLREGPITLDEIEMKLKR